MKKFFLLLIILCTGSLLQAKGEIKKYKFTFRNETGEKGPFPILFWSGNNYREISERIRAYLLQKSRKKKDQPNQRFELESTRLITSGNPCMGAALVNKKNEYVHGIMDCDSGKKDRKDSVLQKSERNNYFFSPGIYPTAKPKRK
ncbi:MAG: hypothetical protein WDZ41_04760 [Candidatus Babeliales bacterium]